MAFEKAKIVIFGEKGNKTVDCVFNPSEYTIRDSVPYSKQKKLLKDTKNVFMGTSTSVFSTTLYFDSLQGNSSNNEEISPPLSKMKSSIKAVNRLYDDLIKTMQIEGAMHRPPKVAFTWGVLNFMGVVTNISQTYTMFTPDGKPVRAKVDITIEAEMGTSGKSSPLESPDRTKCKIITEGMSLWSIAHEEYGDCEKWRVIAKANNLKNPLDLKQGQMVKIPAL